MTDWPARDALVFHLSAREIPLRESVMSTKNLARTVIEGGRAHRNTYERRASHRIVRAKLRPQVELLVRDPEQANDLSFHDLHPVRRMFSDKLGPADRWLQTQVGRPWNKVMSELLQRFDTRTLAGRHVVFDHMAPRQAWPNDGTWRVHASRFRIDAHGFLRRASGLSSSPKGGRHAVSQAVIDRALSWANGLKVHVHGQLLYWCEPTLKDVVADQQRYRQARRLDAEECRFFESLPAECRDLLRWTVHR
jgi:hypothetical protein